MNGDIGPYGVLAALELGYSVFAKGLPAMRANVGGDDVRRRLRRVVVAERAPTRAGEGEARLTTRCDRFRAFGRSVFDLSCEFVT